MRRGTDGDRYLSKVQEGAKVFLDPGESVKAAAWGANSLMGSLLGTARAHIVAVTDRNVYVFESARWRIPGMQLWYERSSPWAPTPLVRQGVPES